MRYTMHPWLGHSDSRLSHVRLLSVPILSLCLTTVWGCAGLVGFQAPTPHCPDSILAKVSVDHPTVRVSYTEPSVTLDGNALTSLAKTSIYYDFGNGRALAKEVPASQPAGGGTVSETITVPTKSKDEQTVKICATATDQNGNEGLMTP